MTSRGEQICPHRIFDDFGQGFSLGGIAGCFFYFFKGMINSPKKERFYGGIVHLKRRAPILGGSFALWAGLFSGTECSMTYFRGKEGPINMITAGFVTGGLLAIRAGFRVAFRNALFGGIFMSIIVLAEHAMIKYQKRQEILMMQKMQAEEVERQKEMFKKMRPDLFVDENKSKKSKKQSDDNKDSSFGVDGSSTKAKVVSF